MISRTKFDACTCSSFGGVKTDRRTNRALYIRLIALRRFSKFLLQFKIKKGLFLFRAENQSAPRICVCLKAIYHCPSSESKVQKSVTTRCYPILQQVFTTFSTLNYNFTYEFKLQKTLKSSCFIILRFGRATIDK